MPYVGSEKTKPPAKDRMILDAVVRPLADEAASRITGNMSLADVYQDIFIKVSKRLDRLVRGKSLHWWSWMVDDDDDHSRETALARAICGLKKHYGYEGAHLGELNYAFTMFIQWVPEKKLKDGVWKEEFRYWVYALTVKALTYTQIATKNFKSGVSGVWEDIKDEYKREMNPPYEIAQMLKSGHCYFGLWYMRPIEVVYDTGEKIGHIEIALKRSEETLHKDILDGQIVVRRKPGH